MHFYTIFFILTLMAMPAMAQDACKTITDMSPDYREGVDVNGNSVLPADINGGDMLVVDPIIVPIEVDLIERFNLNIVNASGVGLEPSVAALAVYPDGKVVYNGRDITDEFYQKCQSNARLTP